ncbi:aspartate/ornithine carbamoyltransferase family protein [Actinokineospora inagensis]|uniref:aspartate/ornithine carbamoyltransferase family protein n=1 Tax=Actinokineospora inagensis TaxID=103730 RepID=UPI00040A9C4B|nr:hypothetical protein [Actinokineospora inagensis]
MATLRATRHADAFTGRHVLSMGDYHPRDLDLLFRTADETRSDLASGRDHRPLAGRLLMSAFFDKSTRTRLAHETAMIRLGGTVAGFADATVTRAGGTTQESDDDIARMVSLYGDVVVVRHPETGWPAHAASLSEAAMVINGGDGVGEHPTQTMVDLYTMHRRFGGLDGLRILILNDLRMRCVRSLLLGLRHFDCTVYGLSASGKDAAALPEGVPPIHTGRDLDSLLSEVDIVYSSPTVAAERPEDSLDRVTLNRDLLRRHSGHDITVMHPLPRKGEVDTDLDDTRFAGYWEQADNGVPVRMALLRLMFGC